VNLTPLARLAIAMLLVGVAGCAGGAEPKGDEGATVVMRAPLEVPRKPVVADTGYRIGARDILSLRILDLAKPGEVGTLELEVGPDGTIPAPFVGAVKVGERTLGDARAAIVAALSPRWIVNPQVDVLVKEYRSRKISVIGAVAEPGIFYLNRERLTLVEGLSLAGGLSKDAGTRVLLIRGGRPTRSIDLVPILLKGDSSGDLPLEPDDVIQVPLAEEFFVAGYVQKPGAFGYHRPTTVMQAVATAGGMDMRRASPSEVTITRMAPGGAEVIEVDLSRVIDGSDPDVPVFPGDSVSVGRTWTWAVVSEVTDMLRGFFGFGINLGTL